RSEYSASARLHDCIQDFVRIVNSAAGVRYGERLCLAIRSALDLTHHLPEVELGHHKCLYSSRQVRNLLFGKWPRGDEPKLPDLQTTFARCIDGPLCDSRGDAVGNDHHVRIIQSFFFEQANAIFSGTNLIL